MRFAVELRAFITYKKRMSYVNSIIDSLGGIRATARIVRKSPSTVQGWKDRGSIPDAQKQDVYDLARAAGFELSARDFLAVKEHAGKRGNPAGTIQPQGTENPHSSPQEATG